MEIQPSIAHLKVLPPANKTCGDAFIAVDLSASSSNSFRSMPKAPTFAGCYPKAIRLCSCVSKKSQTKPICWHFEGLYKITTPVGEVASGKTFVTLLSSAFATSDVRVWANAVKVDRPTTNLAKRQCVNFNILQTFKAAVKNEYRKTSQPPQTNQ